MKRVLIISPYFPPTNAADMQRIRTSLPYFKEFGWEAEVVTVRVEYSDMIKDALLTKTVPASLPVHTVAALPKNITAKVGLGSIAIRSLPFYYKKVNQLLKDKKYDLVYFSTTQFPICILGRYWKNKFGVPFVIDMQDPWHSDYYQDKSSNERPKKYWFSYRLNKILEPIAMKSVDGLISVSEAYLVSLKQRYLNCNLIPSRVITFGAFGSDLEIALLNKHLRPSVLPAIKEQIKVVYVGRGGWDMKEAVKLLFRAFKQCLDRNPDKFKKFHFYFIGTSYAAAGKGIETIYPLAKLEEVDDYVTEITDRIPFYQALNTLAESNALFIPGSNDPGYTASKIYPYIMVQKPLLALFHPDSSAFKILKECEVGTVLSLSETENGLMESITEYLLRVATNLNEKNTIQWDVFGNYSARKVTERQCLLFNEVVQ